MFSGGKGLSKAKLLVVISIAAVAAVGLGLGLGLGLGPLSQKHHSSISSASQQAQDLKQLPPPGSSDAKALLDDSNTPAWIREVYKHNDDSIDITGESTASFLKQLQRQQEIQQQLQQQQSDGPSLLVNSSASSNSSEVNLAPFIRVADDVLNYLRYSRSAALLSILRKFSKTGVLDMQAADPDQLQGEVKKLLSLDNLNRWYVAAGRSDGVGRDPKGKQVQSIHSTAGRHLRHKHQRRHISRRLHGMASIPNVPKAAVKATVGASSTIPTNSPQQSLKDMLCAIEPFNPKGLTGMSAPGSSKITCTPPTLGLFSYKGVAFQPVVIPVVFHCLRFNREGVLGPQLWEPEKAAENMVEVANRLYKGTGIQFKMHEVRTDPEKYPYLLKDSVEEWQACTVNPESDMDGYACLNELTTDELVVPLTEEQHAVNVFVAGSRDEAAWCDKDADPAPVCTELLAGFSASWGPWFADGDPGWSEDHADSNWLFLTWDMFNPTSRNSVKYWNGGGVTFAHEVGHYLGLMHTHEGAEPCEGNGMTKSDAVPDTPVNLQVDEWAAENGNLADLTGWCCDFRRGRQPNVDELTTFNSCGAPGSVDNVFNVMSYSPDPCTLIFTPNQIARMQWAIASFRPKMMAEHAA